MSKVILSKQFTKLLIIVGPSGVGKGTLINRITRDFPNHFLNKISHTTRNIRNGEVNGKNYHFLKRNEFEDVLILFFKI